MQGSNLRPAQLRALLALLVLLPLVPAVVLLRFMVNAVGNERTAARDRLTTVYRQALETARTTLPSRIAARGETASAPEIYRVLRETFEPAIKIRILDGTGRSVAGDEGIGNETPLAAASLEGGLRVELFAQEREDDPAASEQILVYGWTAGGAIVATLVIAGVAAVAVNRRLKLSQLETDSLAAVSHEMRTPLSSMRLLLETLLAQRAADPARQREYVELVLAENQRLIHLTENFLRLGQLESKMRSGSQEVIALREIVESAAARGAPGLRDGACQFSIEIHDSLRVRGDREALVTLFGNLLDNAVKYTRDRKEIGVLAHGRDGRVIIEVRDNGPGIPADEQRLVFDRFYQIDSRLSRGHGGCGLGLYIVQRIVKEHGGTIRVESRPGEGSVFRLELPGEEGA